MGVLPEWEPLNWFHYLKRHHNNVAQMFIFVIFRALSNFSNVFAMAMFVLSVENPLDKCLIFPQTFSGLFFWAITITHRFRCSPFNYSWHWAPSPGCQALYNHVTTNMEPAPVAHLFAPCKSKARLCHWTKYTHGYHSVCNVDLSFEMVPFWKRYFRGIAARGRKFLAYVAQIYRC